MKRHATAAAGALAAVYINRRIARCEKRFDGAVLETWWSTAGSSYETNGDTLVFDCSRVAHDGVAALVGAAVGWVVGALL